MAKDEFMYVEDTTYLCEGFSYPARAEKYTGLCNPKNRLPHGEGIIYFHNGDMFRGVFKNGKPIRGTYTYANSCFVDIYFDDPSHFIKRQMIKHYAEPYGFQQYNEDLSDKLGEDKGILPFLNGKYIGESENEIPNGIGQFSAFDGTVLTGGWKNGKKHGIIVRKTPNGNYYWELYENDILICALSQHIKNDKDDTYSYDDPGDDTEILLN